jgi:hypothetical protein
MDEQLILGLSLVFVAVPGLLIGLSLLAGKWVPAIRTADPARSRRVLGMVLVATDALLLVAGVVLALTAT